MSTPSRDKALTLQKQMEGPLLQLEKLGVLDADGADEIRNIVAEGIAERFEERYRPFPFERAGVQIRRDRVPKDCVLMKRFDAHTKAIEEDRLPTAVAMARKYGNKTPAQPQEARDRQPFGSPRRVPAKQQPVPKGTYYRKPVASEEWAPLTKKSVPEKKSSPNRLISFEKPVLPPKPDPNSQRSSTSKSGSPEKLHKNWQNGLTSKCAEDWQKIMADPAAAFNTLTKSGSSKQTQKRAATSSQNLASPVRTNKPITQAGQIAASATSKDAPASPGSTPAARATDVAVKDGVDGNKKVTVSIMDEPMLYRPMLYEPLLSGPVEKGNGDEAEVKTEEHDSGVSRPTVTRPAGPQPTVEFSGDLIWLGD